MTINIPVNEVKEVPTNAITLAGYLTRFAALCLQHLAEGKKQIIAVQFPDVQMPCYGGILTPNINHTLDSRLYSPILTPVFYKPSQQTNPNEEINEIFDGLAKVIQGSKFMEPHELLQMAEVSVLINYKEIAMYLLKFNQDFSAAIYGQSIRIPTKKLPAYLISDDRLFYPHDKNNLQFTVPLIGITYTQQIEKTLANVFPLGASLSTTYTYFSCCI